MTALRRWYVMLLCGACLSGCHETPALDAAQQAEMSRAMAKMEAGQARSDDATAADRAKANADADSARREAAGREPAE